MRGSENLLGLSTEITIGVRGDDSPIVSANEVRIGNLSSTEVKRTREGSAAAGRACSVVHDSCGSASRLRARACKVCASAREGTRLGRFV